MMKSNLAMLVLALLGTACGSRGVNVSGTVGGSAVQPMTELVVGTMQPVTELAVGTMRLEGTADVVTAEQAADLLPLWEVYKEISSSDTAAQGEIDGLLEQIQASMTDAQTKNISAMKITQEDVMAVMQQQMPEMPAGARPEIGGNNGFPGGGGMPPGGGQMPPGGVMPEGGLATGEGFGGGTQLAGTPPADGAPARVRPSGVPAPVLNALIEYLQDKAAE